MTNEATQAIKSSEAAKAAATKVIAKIKAIEKTSARGGNRGPNARNQIADATNIIGNEAADAYEKAHEDVGSLAAYYRNPANALNP